MRKICIINQKGGVAKTTTTINLATCLAQKGKRVLVLDLDPQGNISTCLCVNGEKTMYNLLTEDIEPFDCIINISENLDVITSDASLAKAELVLAGETSRETFLKRKMESVFNYDYIIIDCPPSLSLLNIKALEALKKMTQTIDEINELFDHDIRITSVIPTMFDKRIKSAKETLSEIKRGYDEIVTDPIRINSKLREAPAAGKDIFEFAKRSRGAQDYAKLAKDVIANEYYY